MQLRHPSLLTSPRMPLQPAALQAPLRLVGLESLLRLAALWVPPPPSSRGQRSLLRPALLRKSGRLTGHPRKPVQQLASLQVSHAWGDAADRDSRRPASELGFTHAHVQEHLVAALGPTWL